MIEKRKKGQSYALNMEIRIKSAHGNTVTTAAGKEMGKCFNDMNPGQLGTTGLCKFTKQIHFTTEHYQETGWATYSTPHISQELHYWASTYTLNLKIV